MQRFLVIAGILSIASAAMCVVYANANPLTKKEHAMQAHEGTYLGFAPTDESAVAMGEIEVVITDREVKARMATGHGIDSITMETADFVEAEPELITSIYRQGSEYIAKTVGFRKKDGFPRLFFLKSPSEGEFGLIVKTGNELAEILGPTILYAPAQVKQGDFEKAVSKLEGVAGKGVLPRLRNNGKAEKD